VLRSVDDPDYVLIDLEFGSQGEAEGLLSAMRRLWRGDGQRVMRNAQPWIVEPFETKEL
jgi:hypothetical protein